MQRNSASRVLFLAVLTTLVAAWVAAPAAAQSDARLAIRVIDPEGNPIPGAQVQVVSVTQGSQREFVTDDEGEYLQRGFRPDTYTVTVRADGYVPQQQEVRLNLGMNAIDVVLPPATGPTEEDAERLNELQQQGIEAYQAGDHGQAIEAMSALLEGLEGIQAEGIDEVRGQALRVLGDSYLKTDDPDAALTAYERLLEMSPESPDVLMGMGQAYAQLEDLETSLDYFRRAMEAAPEDPVAHFNAGVLMIQMDLVDEGRAAMEKAVELRPEFPVAYRQLGYVYARAGDYTQAVEAFQTYLDQSPEAPDRADIEGMITALEAEAIRQQSQDGQQR